MSLAGIRFGVQITTKFELPKKEPSSYLIKTYVFVTNSGHNFRFGTYTGSPVSMDAFG
jgi:hypothetical protein